VFFFAITKLQFFETLHTFLGQYRFDNQCATLLEEIPEKVIELIKNLETQEKTAKK
jgi:hypothetical protein